MNGDGRPDLYVANDEDPNRLYLNEPGGPLGFHFVDVGEGVRRRRPNAGMGIAAADFNGDGRTDLFVTQLARPGARGVHGEWRGRSRTPSRFGPRSARTSTGWGDSWVDLRNNGTPDLVLANGGDPGDEPASATPRRVQVLAPKGEALRRHAGSLRGHAASTAAGSPRPTTTTTAASTSRSTRSAGSSCSSATRRGGPLARGERGAASRRAPSSPPSSPRAGRLVREVQAGSSYLSSEDPRVHFGLGKATVATEVIVHYPDGTVKRLHNVRADRILTIRK